MGVTDVEHAKRKLQDILRKAQKLDISTHEVLATRTAQKLLAKTKNLLAWSIWIGIFVVILSGVVYARWPTRQEVETIRTVLRRTVSLLEYFIQNAMLLCNNDRTSESSFGCISLPKSVSDKARASIVKGFYRTDNIFLAISRVSSFPEIFFFHLFRSSLACILVSSLCSQF